MKHLTNQSVIGTSGGSNADWDVQVHWTLAITHLSISRIRLQHGWSHGSQFYGTGQSWIVDINRTCAVNAH